MKSIQVLGQCSFHYARPVGQTNQFNANENISHITKSLAKRFSRFSGKKIGRSTMNEVHARCTSRRDGRLQVYLHKVLPTLHDERWWKNCVYLHFSPAFRFILCTTLPAAVHSNAMRCNYGKIPASCRRTQYFPSFSTTWHSSHYGNFELMIIAFNSKLIVDRLSVYFRNNIEIYFAPNKWFCMQFSSNIRREIFISWTLYRESSRSHGRLFNLISNVKWISFNHISAMPSTCTVLPRYNLAFGNNIATGNNRSYFKLNCKTFLYPICTATSGFFLLCFFIEFLSSNLVTAKNLFLMSSWYRDGRKTFEGEKKNVYKKEMQTRLMDLKLFDCK